MPFPFAALIFAGISFVGQSLLAPKPKFSTPKQAGLSDFDIATADESRAIPYVAGNVKLYPNITWYGDLISTPIKKFVKTSMLGTGVRQTLGYRYNLGWEAGLCYGPGVSCKKITYDDKEIFAGTLNGIPSTATILQENLFGGEGEDGEGGINWILDFYSGDASQPVNPYMLSRVTPYPAHRRVSYVVSRGPSSGVIRDGSGKYVSGTGYIGKTAGLRDIAFYLERLPNAVNPSKAVIGSDVNPIEVIYEWITNRIYGGKIASSRIDSAAFIAASNTLHAEGFGVSVNWGEQGGVEEVLQQMMETIDGALYMDYATGLITIRLVRNDYNPATIRSFGPDDIVEFESFSRGSWEDTANQLDYTFVSRADDYKSMPDSVHELANFNFRGVPEVAKKDYNFIYERTLAQKAALRDMRIMALPLARGRVRLNRSGSLMYPSEPFKITWPKLGLDNKIFRAANIDYGSLRDGRVSVDIIEDQFTFGEAVYTVINPSGWVNPVGAAQAATLVKVLEQPRFFHASDAHRPLSLVAAATGAHLGYDVQASTDGGANYALIESNAVFTPVGQLVAAYGQLTSDYDLTGFEITDVQGVSAVFDVVPDEVRQGGGIIYFEDTGELAAFEDISYSSVTGRYTVAKVWRGILDTPPTAHASGSRVWFVGFGSGRSEAVYANATALKLKHPTRTLGGELSLAAATAQDLTIAQRALKPYPPANFRVDGSYTGTTHTGDVELTWNRRNRLTQAEVLKQSAADQALEAGASFTLKIYNQSNTLIRTETGLTGTSYTYTQATETADNGGSLAASLKFELYAVSGGLESAKWVRTSMRV
jgi:hypothetical protein